MINHISLTAILCEKDDSIYRKAKIIRNYKNIDGYFEEDIINCIMWTRNNKNALFSYNEGTFVAIDGRIEVIEGNTCVVVEQIMYLASNTMNYVNKEGV